MNIHAPIALLVLMLSTTPIIGQSQQPPDPDIEIRHKMERDQVKALNKERQASLKKDMEELYRLATELKASVDKTDEHVLSLQVIRNSERIEKLAREIRKKMKDAY